MTARPAEPQKETDKTMATHNSFTMDDLTDVVAIKNRIVDGPVNITYDSKPQHWDPGETKRMPRKVAEFLRHKSLFRFNPGDHNEGIPPKWDYKLAIEGDAHDESDLTHAEVLAQKELLDVRNMPELTRTGQDGQPLRRVYIDPRSTGAMGVSDSQRMAEERVTKQVSSAIVADAAGKIADAARGLSEKDIEQAVRRVAADAAGPAGGE